MPRTYSKLDWSLISRFGDRKKLGYVSIIINVDNGEVYIVPRDTEHIEVLTKILSMDIEDLREHPELAANLVPSIIEIKDEEVYGILTGFSGSESGYNIRHTVKQLDKGHALALKFVEKGNILQHQEFTHKVIYRYARS